jgi:hypothetical protein
MQRSRIAAPATVPTPGERFALWTLTSGPGKDGYEPGHGDSDTFEPEGARAGIGS